MSKAVIVDAIRTPFGKRNGSFSDTHPQDLVAETLRALEERNAFDSEIIEDVIYRCVTSVDEQGRNIARLAPLIAGWDETVPGVQLNRMCGSGQEALHFAAMSVMADQHDVLVAGGVENMTRVVMSSDSDALTDTCFEHLEMVNAG